jgi:hypothetical protein
MYELELAAGYQVVVLAVVVGAAGATGETG